MSEPYQIISIRPDGLDPLSGVRTCHELFSSFGIHFDEDSLMLLAASGDDEPEPRPVVTPDEALKELAAWPALGSLVYEAADGPLTVTYEGSAAPRRIQVVVISVLQRAVERRDAVSRYIDLASALHHALGSTRTIMDWGLEARGFRWPEEVVRLRSRQFEGTYEYADLRR